MKHAFIFAVLFLGGCCSPCKCHEKQATDSGAFIGTSQNRISGGYESNPIGNYGTTVPHGSIYPYTGSCNVIHAEGKCPAQQ